MNEEKFKKQAKDALAQCKIINNNDGTIDIIGNLTVKFPLKYLPKIKNLIGNLDCRNNNYITNLINAPETVTLDLHCNNCDSLKTLEGAPKSVRNFYCFDSKSLETLKGAPQTVGGNFECSNCPSLESLKGAPKTIDGYFNCAYCHLLESLKGATQTVSGDFFCYNCIALKTLEGAPTQISGNLDFENCTSLTTSAKSDWLKTQAIYKKRNIFETSTTNQAESTWKYSK